MMQAMTDNERLAEGMRLIAELHNLRQEVHTLRALMQAVDNTAQREEEARRAEAERRAAEEKAERDKELNEAIARVERLLKRDYCNDPYLRRIYGPGRPGTRRTYE